MQHISYAISGYVCVVMAKFNYGLLDQGVGPKSLSFHFPWGQCVLLESNQRNDIFCHLEQPKNRSSRSLERPFTIFRVQPQRGVFEDMSGLLHRARRRPFLVYWWQLLRRVSENPLTSPPPYFDFIYLAQSFRDPEPRISSLTTILTLSATNRPALSDKSKPFERQVPTNEWSDKLEDEISIRQFLERTSKEKPVKPASHCAVDDSEGSRLVWLGVEWWADVSNVLSQAGMDITYVLRVLKVIFNDGRP
ncbi:predicted protein [Histoplasma capsulatum var. duboisii H88]|uniref:Predicted protein n=1 Tax=Ajellomyces capsulatus (strain H88) TaxID=544711 RepID=F0UDC8_AJEC8|nr:predicted protein [Histoplasma capsulatum var. duboisii H88]